MACFWKWLLLFSTSTCNTPPKIGVNHHTCIGLSFSSFSFTRYIFDNLNLNQKRFYEFTCTAPPKKRVGINIHVLISLAWDTKRSRTRGESFTAIWQRTNCSRKWLLFFYNFTCTAPSKKWCRSLYMQFSHSPKTRGCTNEPEAEIQLSIWS